MKKTKKAVLAALACTVAIAGSGLILAACDDSGNDPAKTPEAHSHVWSNWTVEEGNKPSAQSGGKATRNCNGKGECDADVSLKEYDLPALDDNSYTISNDTAQVGVAGTAKYSYNKNGVAVEFTATSPAKPHVHVGGAWTVTEDNKPSMEETGWATRVCNAEDNFCDWTEDDLKYELPDLNDIAYSVDLTNSISTCTTAGFIKYTYNKNGVNVTFTIETEIDPDAHSLVTHEGRAATCEANGTADYFTCANGCGKIFKDADAEEEFADLDATVIDAKGHKLTSVAAYSTSNTSFSKTFINPKDTAVIGRGIAHYKCSVCKKTFKDENGTNEITALYGYRGMFLENLGENLVDITDVSATNTGMGTNKYLAFYVTQCSGEYTFTISDGTVISGLGIVLSGTAGPDYAYNNNAWNTSAASYEKFVGVDTESEPSHTVTVKLKKGEWFVLLTSSTQYSINAAVNPDPVFEYGNNVVMITEAYADFVDTYEFTPTETKTYSMTVPKDVEVVMNNKDLIVNGKLFANFDGVAGETITFSFRNSKTGFIEITIGEEIELPKLTVDGPLNNFSIDTFTASVLEIGDIEEGTYTVTIAFSQQLGRSQCYFGKNISENISDYYDGNGSTINGCPAWVNFQFPMATVLNNADCTAERVGTSLTCNVTLNLKKGDKLVFIVSNTSGTANISMAAAA